MTAPNLAWSLDRTIVIHARRETVFRYFTDSVRFASWWGAGSSIDPKAGGAVRIVYPGNVVALGEVLEIREPDRIVFSYGYEDPAKPIRPGQSRVTITLEAIAKGTKLTLVHAVADETTRDMHVPGWRYQLALFSNIASAEEHAGVADEADAWFRAWAEPDAAKRRAALDAVVVADVEMRDAFSCVRGLDDLVSHITAIHMHMPGIAMSREGAPRQCQGTALVEWIARASDGAERMRGTNVLELAPDGRIARVTGLRATT